VENNTFNNNTVGILIQYSDSNTVFNNTCNNNNNLGIHLAGSSHNTVENNTCNSNNIGIFLETTLLIDRDSRSTFWDESQNNTVANNICNNNEVGIRLNGSSHNTVENNTCNSNDIGISLNRIQVIYFFNNYEYWAYSLSNNVANNTCNYNRIGIYLLDPHSNTVVNNSFLGNTEHDILEDFAAKKFDTEDLLFIGFVGVIGLAGIIMLGAAWRMFSGIREFTET
jgi:parallel beta-helix repeat protein